MIERFKNIGRSNKIMNKRGQLTNLSYLSSEHRMYAFLNSLERKYDLGIINKEKYLKYKNELLSEVKGFKGFIKRLEFNLEKCSTMLFH